jgi:hypothetical protein
MLGILKIRNENELLVVTRKNEILLPISRGGYLLRPREVWEDLEDGAIYAKYQDLLCPYLLVYAHRNWTRVSECAVVSVSPDEEGAHLTYVLPIARNQRLEFLLNASEQGFETVRFLLFNYEEPIVDEKDIDEAVRRLKV